MCEYVYVYFVDHSTKYTYTKLFGAQACGQVFLWGGGGGSIQWRDRPNVHQKHKPLEESGGVPHDLPVVCQAQAYQIVGQQKSGAL